MTARSMPSSFGPIRLASRALAFAQATCSTLARPNWGGPRFVLIDLRGMGCFLGSTHSAGGVLAFKKAGRCVPALPFLRETEVPFGIRQ